ncbi:MAG TPA: Clp protease N-terminal domain-containing protein [Streptosporangiaceae bacterium]|nr:Clp protease N-terminal domain-containing protein [Streptosporangiaceae bacterium]
MSDGISPAPTPRYYSVLGGSSEIARGMGHAYAGVEHLFLAIIHDLDAVPTQVLAGMVDLGEVEARMRELMNSPGYAATSRELQDRPGCNGSD